MNWNSMKQRIGLLAIILMGIVISGVQNVQAQNFQNAYLTYNEAGSYTSLDAKDGPGYVLAGTIYNAGADTARIHVMRLDDVGNVMWSRVFDNWQQSYCFSIAYGVDGYVVAGMLEVDGMNRMAAFSIDVNGFLLPEKYIYEDPKYIDLHSQALHIVNTSDQGYLISGFLNRSYDLMDEKIAVVVKINQQLKPQWTRYLNTPTDNIDWDMAEHGIEVNGHGYFITGSINNNVGGSTQQGVLAVMLDYAGAKSWDQSFHSYSLREVGASAVYDGHRIYLLSNNMEHKTFMISKFNVFGSPVGEFLYDTNGVELSAFSLINNDTKSLVITGLIRSRNYSLLDGNGNPVSFVNNSPTFLLSIDKHSGTELWNTFYEIPSVNTGSYGDFFAPFSGQQPIIYTSEMTILADDRGFLTSAHRSNSSLNIDLEVIKTDNQGLGNACPAESLVYTTYPIPILRTEVEIEKPEEFTYYPPDLREWQIDAVPRECRDIPTAPICDCDPVNFMQAVNAGIITSTQCTLGFIAPAALTDCDVVTWSGTGGLTAAGFVTIGNSQIVHNYPGPGNYKVTMSIVRYDDDGNICATAVVNGEITITIDEYCCSCDPEFFYPAVDAGFTYQITSTGYVFTPVNVWGNCNEVVWFVDGILVGTSLGSASFTYNTPPFGPIGASMEICMRVDRITLTQVCTREYCLTIGGPPSPEGEGEGEGMSEVEEEGISKGGGGTSEKEKEWFSNKLTKTINAYPNPFTNHTSITVQVPETTQVTIEVYDISGKQVANICNNETLATGNYQYTFNANHLTTGLYICKVQAENKVQYLKLVRQ